MKLQRDQRNNKTILVVVDDPHTRSFVMECITHMGQEVVSATSGEEAMKIIHNQEMEINLLLSDVAMPGINGIELAKTIVEKAPSTKVIFMSGCLQPALSFTETARYQNGFIQKPFSRKTLTSHVKKALIELNQDTTQ